MSALEPSTRIKDHVNAAALALKELALGRAIAGHAPSREVEIVPPGGGDLRAALPVHSLTVPLVGQKVTRHRVSNLCNPLRPASPLREWN